MSKTFAIVGPGRVGQALIRDLTRAGYTWRGVMAGTVQRSKQVVRQWQSYVDGPCYTQWNEIQKHARIVLITTPDQAIRATVQKLVKHTPPNTRSHSRSDRYVFHTSGALRADALAPLRALGYYVGTMHPLQTVTAERTAHVRDIVWGIEGDEQALLLAESIITALQGEAVRMSAENKPAYHAAAVFASNFIVVVAHQAVELLQHAGMTEKQAHHALLPLMQGAVNNIKQVGVNKALTGPFERGDIETVQAHMRALANEQQGEQWLAIYKILGEAAAHLAHQQGRIPEHVSREIQALLRGDENIDVASKE